jgi:hypothetical protein
VIGTGTPRPESPVASLSLLSFNDEYWLGITVGADPTVANTELTPRVRLTASPYAINAGTVDGLHAADLLDKEIYDSNSDGIVDVAAVAKGVDFAPGVNLQLNNGFVATGAGTLSSPGFTFTGDPNTGIYAPAADILGFSTGGTSRLTLSSTGVNAGSSAITTTGTLSAGPATVTSLNVGNGAITTTGTLSAGAAMVTVLSTGQGAYELYAMDQNVRTTDTVTFGKTLVPAGATATPTFAFSGDTDTGIYQSATGEISFSGNGEHILTLAEKGASDNSSLFNGNLCVYRTGDLGGVPSTVRLAIGDANVGLSYSNPLGTSTDGSLLFFTAGLERARVHRDGNFMLATGKGFQTGGGSWGTVSDERLKKNIAGLSGSLDALLKLRGVTFEWKDPEKMGNQPGTQTGFIAQEVETVFPKWVDTTPDGFKGICLPVGFSALTVEAIRELAAKNAALEADLAATKATLAEVLKRLTALEAAK